MTYRYDDADTPHEDPVIVLADRHGVGVEAWMVHPTWGDRAPGCADCNHIGPEAECWGSTDCHGYDQGCGCHECERRVSGELAEFHLLTAGADDPDDGWE